MIIMIFLLLLVDMLLQTNEYGEEGIIFAIFNKKSVEL